MLPPHYNDNLTLNYHHFLARSSMSGVYLLLHPFTHVSVRDSGCAGEEGDVRPMDGAVSVLRGIISLCFPRLLCDWLHILYI